MTLHSSVFGSARILRAPFGILPKDSKKNVGWKPTNARWKHALPRRGKDKKEEIPPVVNSSPAHKIIGATSVDFGAQYRAA
jgi:hypothetical protein